MGNKHSGNLPSSAEWREALADLRAEFEAWRNQADRRQAAFEAENRKLANTVRSQEEKLRLLHLFTVGQKRATAEFRENLAELYDALPKWGAEISGLRRTLDNLRDVKHFPRDPAKLQELVDLYQKFLDRISYLESVHSRLPGQLETVLTSLAASIDEDFSELSRRLDESAGAWTEAGLSPSLVAHLLERLDQRAGGLAVQQREWVRQVTAVMVRVARGTAPPAVAAAPGDPAAVFPADGLVPVRMGEIGGKPCQVVNARDLHGFMEVGKKFASWITGRISKYGFQEDVDFSCVSQNRETQRNDGGLIDFPNLGNQRSGRGGDRRTKDYLLTPNMAKELGMIENNPKGRQIRRYFIDCEERYRERRLRSPAGPLSAPAAPSAGRPTRAALIAPEWLYTLADDLYAACVTLVNRPVVRRSAEGSATIRHSNDGTVLRDGKVLAFLLRTVPKNDRPWPFTASSLAAEIGLRGGELMKALRRFQGWGFAGLDNLGKQGKSGPTFQLRIQWEALSTAARELGVNLEALAGARAHER
jgi:phage anti-repressor protein